MKFQVWKPIAAITIACALGASALAWSPSTHSSVQAPAPTSPRGFPALPAMEPASTEPTTTTEPPPTIPPPPVSDTPMIPTNQTPVSSGYPPECDNPIVAPAVVWRESHCTWDAVNPGGCSGRSCLGFFQEDAGHYYAQSPWNPNVPGVCFGLDWHIPADQIECASRLGPGAWG